MGHLPVGARVALKVDELRKPKSNVSEATFLGAGFRAGIAHIVGHVSSKKRS